VVAVVGFRDDRIAEALCGSHRPIGRRTSSCRGTGRPQFARILLSPPCPGELDRDVAGAARDGRLDALLVLAVTQLNELCSFRRSQGMLRSSAAFTRDAVEDRAAPLRIANYSSRFSFQFQSAGSAPFVRRAWGSSEQSNSIPSSPAAIPHRAAVFVHDRVNPRTSVLRVLPNDTSSPAMFCSSIATCSSTCRARCPRLRASA